MKKATSKMKFVMQLCATESSLRNGLTRTALNDLRERSTPAVTNFHYLTRRLWYGGMVIALLIIGVSIRFYPWDSYRTARFDTTSYKIQMDGMPTFNKLNLYTQGLFLFATLGLFLFWPICIALHCTHLSMVFMINQLMTEAI
jgi:hypothetical protein